jgi:hypothetical protein
VAHHAGEYEEYYEPYSNEEWRGGEDDEWWDEHYGSGRGGFNISHRLEVRTTAVLAPVWWASDSILHAIQPSCHRAPLETKQQLKLGGLVARRVSEDEAELPGDVFVEHSARHVRLEQPSEVQRCMASWRWRV